jgi:hypothetical protein
MAAVNGRLFRAILGGVLCLSALLSYFLSRPHDGWEDPAMHIAVLVGGLALIDPKIAGEILDGIRAWRKP